MSHLQLLLYGFSGSVNCSWRRLERAVFRLCISSRKIYRKRLSDISFRGPFCRTGLADLCCVCASNLAAFLFMKLREMTPNCRRLLPSHLWRILSWEALFLGLRRV